MCISPGCTAVMIIIIWIVIKFCMKVKTKQTFSLTSLPVIMINNTVRVI